jgi:uncharacterized protein (DUF983 family)
MSEHAMPKTASPVLAGLAGRCPRCGKGRLFSGYLTLAPACPACGLDQSAADTGDGPAVFLILIVGVVVVAGALISEVAYQPPYWVHAIIWGPLAVILPLLLLRPAKGLMRAMQFQFAAREGELEQREDKGDGNR